MSELFERLSQPSTWVEPTTILVVKSTKRSYPAYYNANENKWGGLLQATIYKAESDVPNIEDSEAVDYRKEVGLLK